MTYKGVWIFDGLVALLAEGVDRNRLARYFPYDRLCRPPRGGRG